MLLSIEGKKMSILMILIGSLIRNTHVCPDLGSTGLALTIFNPICIVSQTWITIYFRWVWTKKFDSQILSYDINKKGLAPFSRGQKTRKFYYKWLTNEQYFVMHYRSTVVDHKKTCWIKSMSRPFLT